MRKLWAKRAMLPAVKVPRGTIRCILTNAMMAIPCLPARLVRSREVSSRPGPSALPEGEEDDRLDTKELGKRLEGC